MGKYDDDEGGYFSDILKEGLTDSEMSGWDVCGVLVSVWSERLSPIRLSGPVKSLVSRVNLVITIREIPRTPVTRIIKPFKEKAPLPKSKEAFLLTLKISACQRFGHSFQTLCRHRQLFPV